MPALHDDLALGPVQILLGRLVGVTSSHRRRLGDLGTAAAGQFAPRTVAGVVRTLTPSVPAWAVLPRIPATR